MKKEFKSPESRIIDVQAASLMAASGQGGQTTSNGVNTGLQNETVTAAWSKGVGDWAFAYE